MNRRNLLRALCLLLIAVLLGGCNIRPEDNPLPTRPPLNTGPLISIPDSVTEPTTQVTVPEEETQPPPQLEPVVRMTAIKWRTVPQLLSLGNGDVLACRNYFQEGKGIVNLLDIFNVYEDRILVQEQNSTPRELVAQQFPDGHFILKEPRTNTFYVYDRTLQITKQFSCSNVDGYFSYDRQSYYFVDNRVLYRMDIATGNYARMALEYDLRLHNLIGVHPDRDIVVAKFYLSAYNDNTGVCVIDCATGKILLLNAEASHVWLDGDTFYAAVPNDKMYGNDICYGSLSDHTLQKASTSLLGSDTVSYTMLHGSGILMHRTVDENNLSTTVYDLSRGGISSQLSQYGYLTSTLGAIYLRQEQLIFGVYPDEYDYSPVVIDPKSLAYEKSLNLNKEIWPALVDRSTILNYQFEVTGPQLPDDLLPLRQQADALEQKHGIRILIENQITGLCVNGTVEANPQTLSAALIALDGALSLYPEGFLKQFQNGIGEGGLFFCLTGRIQGALDPVGLASRNGERYIIALDITATDLKRTVHHEMWHAIEMKLSTDRFDLPQWTASNPQDFQYYGHYDSGYRHLTQWTYAQSGEQCHFVDAYARINPREDRARLMEYVMSEDASALLRSAFLHSKLEIISKAIRDQFDTNGWQTPYWERYL